LLLIEKTGIGLRLGPADARLHGVVLQKLGRSAEAVADLRESVSLLRSLARPTSVDDYDIACGLSLLSAVEPNSAIADEAMAVLRRAIADGYRDVAYMKVDTDLDPIRDRPGFRLLMMDLTMPDDAFATPTGPMKP
jgi:hypothetical protein